MKSIRDEKLYSDKTKFIWCWLDYMDDCGSKECPYCDNPNYIIIRHKSNIYNLPKCLFYKEKKLNES